MNLVLINSPLQDYGKTKRNDYYTTPPVGLGYLGTIAKQQGCEVSLVDAEALGLSPEETSKVVEEKKPDVVGINLTTPTLPFSRKIIEQLDVPKIIAGGPDATIRPQKILEQVPEIDLLVRVKENKLWRNSFILDLILLGF